MPSVPLLRQKLKIPPGWASALPRDRLLARFDEAIAAGQHLALIAGSGYGKSTALAAWARARSVAWVTLEAEDADLESFLSYLIGAFEAAQPGFQTEARSLLSRVRERAEAMAAVTALLADLDEQWEHPTVLVLDEYHLAASPSLDALLQRLFKLLPPSIRLAIATRHRPDLELAALQARQALRVFDASELAFDLDELRSLRPELSEADLSDLRESTGGLPAAMGLTPEMLDAYVHEQVLSGLSDETRAPLTRLSILDRFDARAAEIACGEPLSPATRDLLLRLNLIQPSDGGEFAVPQPVRHILRRQLASALGQDERNALLVRVGEHHWAMQQPLTAVRLWVEGGLVDHAADRVDGIADAWLTEGRLEALHNALATLGALEGRPELKSVEGEVLRRWGEFTRAEACFEAAMQAFAKGAEGRVRTRLRQAFTAASRGQVAIARDHLAAIASRLRGGDRLEMDARNLEGGLELLTGSTTGAIAHFDASLRLARILGDPYAHARAVHNLGVCHSRRGDFLKALACYDEALAPAGSEGGPTVWMTPINRSLTLAYLDRLDEALEGADRALALVRRYRLSREEGYALRTLGFARMRARDLDGALECFVAAEQLARQTHDTLGIAYSLNFLAELHVARKDAAAARKACEEVEAVRGVRADGWPAPEFAIVRAKVLTLSGDRAEATALLEALRRGAETEAQRDSLREIEELLAESPVPAPARPIVSPQRPELVIQCLGGFRVSRQDGDVSEGEWHSARAKLLLAYLLHTQEGATKARLFEVLYPNVETTDASMKMNLMRVRKVLEPDLEKGAASRYLLRQEACYAFNRQARFELDTWRFENELRAARQAPGEERIAGLRGALDLYLGEFMPGFDQEWAIAMRQRFQDLALEACRELLTQLEETRLPGSLDIVHRALEIDPLSEEFHREIILRFLEADEAHRAVAHYRLCRRRFQEILNMEPPEDLRALVAHLG
jgi:DNA-binding SARP family transcriptional activator/tetratricopeptide (TPR) repeat protein